MKRELLEFLPQARKRGMVIKEVDNEVLVFDTERDRAHCLNLSAAAIWRLCDGKTTPSSLANLLEGESGQRVDERIIWLGLRDLRRSHLLEAAQVWPEQVTARKGMSRREAVRRIGLGTAMALPLVISMTAPTLGQSASCKATCERCGNGGQCCSGVCVEDPANCATGKRCT